jgi:3-dehydroquinate dehydratase
MLRHLTTIEHNEQYKNKKTKSKEHKILLTQFGANSYTLGATKLGKKSTIIVLVQSPQ